MESKENPIHFISIDILNNEHIILLFEHLKKKSFPISHKNLPSFDEHKEFVLTSPYRFWFLVKNNGQDLGNCFISYQNCIGLNVITNKKDDYAMILEKIFKEFSPLPAIKSIRTESFHVNSNPQNRLLKEALISFKMDLLEETYIKRESPI